MSPTLALDLGGTNLRAGLCEPGRPHAVEPVGRWAAPADLQGFETLVRDLVERHAVTRLGLAVPGLAAGTVCIWIPNVPYLNDVDLAGLFPGVSVVAGNDAHLALLAEASAGAARGLSDVVLLAIGTGIGSAVLSGSRIVRGSRGAAVSFGWACADLADLGDERHGWLERQASGRAIDRLAAEAGYESAVVLIDRAREGDADARRLLDDPARALGVALAGAVALLDPEAVVITGGLATALDVLEPAARAAMMEQLPPHLRETPLVAGEFGPAASLTGAAIAACGSKLWEQSE